MMLSKQELFVIRTNIEDLSRDGQPQTIGATLRNQIRNLLADRDELAAENAALRRDAKLGKAVRCMALHDAGLDDEVSE